MQNMWETISRSGFQAHLERQQKVCQAVTWIQDEIEHLHNMDVLVTPESALHCLSIRSRMLLYFKSTYLQHYSRNRNQIVCENVYFSPFRMSIGVLTMTSEYDACNPTYNSRHVIVSTIDLWHKVVSDTNETQLTWSKQLQEMDITSMRRPVSSFPTNRSPAVSNHSTISGFTCSKHK
jgi:hypothetical protein